MKNRNYFLIFCILSILLIGIIFGINSIMRGTNASFGGVTGVLGSTYKVTYYANWPDDGMGEDSNEYEVGKIYQVLSNMYAVPSGYEFLGWSTEPDGVVVYSEGHVMSLSDNLNLYAVWGLVDTEEEKVLAYGDVNLNGEIDDDDYLLIDSYLLDSSVLSGQALINADVNTDGKIDNIDSDIVKQAYLGTEGYTGMLPNNPILIYELYEKLEDNEDNDSSSEGSGNTSSGNGTGSGGSGTGSSGNGGGNTSSGGNKGNTSNGGNVNGSTSSGSLKEDNSDNDTDAENTPKVYEFKFMNGKMEYAITKCDVIENDSCDLVLPNTVPSKSGYKFIGWSLEEDCSKNIIKETITVNSGNIYYACFLEVETDGENKEGFNIWIIVGVIWMIAMMLIYRIVKQFNNKEENN